MFKLNRPAFENECTFKTSRSSGKGGQHVNKVESKVELLFDIINSSLFNEDEKNRLLKKLINRLLQSGILQVTASEARSQWLNKQHAIEKAALLIEEALIPEKPRHKTKPTQSSVENRLKKKQLQGIKKLYRRNTGIKTDYDS